MATSFVPSPRAASQVRWRMLAILVAYSFMSWFNRISLPVAYDEQIKAELHISEEGIGWAYSSFLIAYTLCMTPGGWLVDRVGPRLALALMGLGSALFGALTGLAGLPALVAAGLVLPALLVIRPLMGVLSAPLYPGASRSVSFWIPPGGHNLANGLVQSGAALGIALAFPLFGRLIDHVGWPTGFVISGGVTALLGLIWAVYATDYPAQHAGVNKAELQMIQTEAARSRAPDAVDPRAVPPQAASASWLQLFSNRSLVLLTLSYSALGYLEYLFFFWMHYYFDHVLHVGKDASRNFWVVLNLSFAAGMIGGGYLTDRIEGLLGHGKGRAVVAMVGMTAGAVFLWLGLVAAEVNWIVICLALALAGVGGCEAVVWATAVELGGHHGATAAGICNTGGNLVGLIAPILTPFVSHQIAAVFGVSEQLGWQWGIALGGLICLLGAVLWIWIRPVTR